MALRHIQVMKCKNKLCDYTGTKEYYTSGRHDLYPDNYLVCPACGFKTLVEYYPELEEITKAMKGD